MWISELIPQDFKSENEGVFFLRRTRTHDFHRRTRTQDFVTKNDKVFSYEKSYPTFGGYKFSRRTRTLILLSTISLKLEKSYLGTSSPGEIVPGYDFSRRSRTQFFGYEFSWVRLLLRPW
jgi:hypothetical protein